MSVYRTAQGKIIDMAALAAKNQKVRAVGNMKVNARGDTIDSYGRVIEPVTEKVSSGYAKTVGNRSAQPVRPRYTKQMAEADAQAAQQPIKEELTDYEREINSDLEDDDAAIEAIKSKERK